MAGAWTEFQQKAIAAQNTDICVAAGAGSGKTGVLVERFVRLIVQSNLGELPPDLRAGIDEILVITFTEKATKEMKARIVSELNRLGLLAERRQVETAYISTIHGFCSRLLQENPFEAGVDPQFTVLDEVQSRRLLRQVFETVIERAYDEKNAEITELVAAVQTAQQYGDTPGDPLSGLSNAIAGVLAKVRGAGISLREMEAHWLLGKEASAARSLEPLWMLLAPALDEIRACVQALESLRLSVGGTMEIARGVVLEKAPALLSRETDVATTMTALEDTFKAVGRARPRYSNAPAAEMEMHQLFERVRIACEEAKSLFGVTAAREEEAGLLCHRFWGLLVAVRQAYDEEKRGLGKLDTDDLQAEGVRLLEESPSVRRRYQRRFRYLMVDEFQDTNPLQMRLIELLHVSGRNAPRPVTYDAGALKNGGNNGAARMAGVPDVGTDAMPEFPSGEDQNGAESASTPLRRNGIFVVGDVQQSIYGFRHADSTLFRDLERRFREDGAGLHVPLAVNFRSRPEILSLVKHVFRQVWRDSDFPFVPLTPGASFDAKSEPSLEIMLTQDLYRRDYVRLESEALAARIQQMVEGREFRITSKGDKRRGEPIAYRDVAILLRGLTDIEQYEQAFARRGVPYYVVGGGRGYYARHEIRDLLNVLTVLDTPLDDVALAAALRSPMVGADVDTLFRLALHAGRSPEGDKAEPLPESVRVRGPLHPALPSLLESGELPLAEAEKLRRFVNTMEALRAQEDRLPVGHLLERLIAQTQYDARLLCRPGGRRRLANVRKMLHMANSDSVLGARDFIRRLREIEKISAREGDAPTEEEAADVVRFLTIHSAKGLEFPVVALADLSRGLLIPERGLFACEPQCLALGTRLGGDPNVVYKAIDARRQAADRQESERLLYVAMTRAREHLILCGNIGRNRGFNWADSLFPLLGVLEAPPEPHVQKVAGGVPARIAPISHYVHTSQSSEPTLTQRQKSEARADGIARAILDGRQVFGQDEQDSQD